MLWKNVSHLIFIIALQWPTLSQFVLSLISPVSRLLPKFVVTAEELGEQLRRGGWNKALVLLSESCLRQSDCFWQSFPNQRSALSFDVWTFGLFSRAPHIPWVAARRSRELRAAVGCFILFPLVHQNGSGRFFSFRQETLKTRDLFNEMHYKLCW